MTDPIVPIIGGQRPETELQRAAREAQNARVRHSLQIALTRDPNKVAERVNLNAASTVDDYIVAEEKRRQDIIRVTGKTEMSPVTAQWLSNPDYANISWQDTDALTKVEGLSVGGVLKELAGGTMTFAAGALSAVAAFPERLIDAFRTAGYSPPEFRRMLLEDLQRQGLTGRQLKRIEQQITPQTQEEWIAEGGVFPAISSFLRSVGQGAQATQFYAEQFLTDVKTPLKELLDEGGVDPSSTTAAIYGGFRSLPAMLAVAPLYPVLGVHGAGAAFVVPLYGNSINRARLEGMSEQAAHTYALGQAGIEYLTNIVPGGKFLAGMKLKSPLLQRIKDQLPAELVQENIATAAQDLLDMAALEPDKTFEEYLRERPERAWHTIVATTVGVASLNTTIRVAEQLTTRIDTEEQITKSNGDFVQGVIDNLRDTNLAKQSPQKAAEFVNLASQITGRDVARIDSEVLGQILAESEDRDDFLAEFPSIGQQLNQNGADPGSEVELPTGDFVARMALSEKYQDIASKMQPNLRIGNAEFSLAEESQIEEERQRIREQTEQQVQQSLESEERQAEQRQVILKELRDFAAQMPGITKKQASSAAEIAVTSWESLARAFNMEVGELWDLHKPVLTAGQITIPELGGQGILSQPVTPEADAAYMEAVKAGDVEAQQAAVNRAAGVPDVFDAKDGYGAVSNNQEVDYRGFRAFLTPEQFRSLVPPGVSGESTRSFISEKLSSGEKIGQPFLLVDWDKENGVWRVSNHEGRSRSDAFADVFGQQPMEVHFFPLNARAESITPEMRVAPIIGQEGVGRLQLSSDMDARAITRDAEGNVIPLSQRFDVEQPSILYASEADDTQRRGAYLPRSMEIILSEKADATTLIHEFIHHYLHTLSLLAHNQDAPEAVTSQFQTLLDWFGVEDLAAWDALPASEKAVHHEAFTYNFEIYLGTGKAPTKRLEKVFAKVAKWMRGIYGKIRGALSSAYEKEFPGRKLPVLTPSVIEVFDTMMGAEAEVATAAADMQMIPVFQTQEESAMSDEEWEAYNLGAELYIDQATAKLTATTARAMRWLDNAMARVIRAKNKTAKEQRKAIREGIQAEVESRPVYRAINMLRRGVFVDEQGNERQVPKPYRLDAARVQELFPAKEGEPGYLDLSPLRTGRYGMVVKNGLDPAVVAEQFGFASAAELVKELVAARPINDVINELTDEEIKERHPELKPEAIKQAAMESLHNEALAKFVSRELQFLGGINKPVRVIMEAARREAEAEVAQMSHRNIKPAKFLAAERRAAKTAQQWMAKGDRRATAEQSKALSQARKALKAAKETQDADIIAAAEQDVKQAQQAMMDALGEINKQPGRATVNAVVRAKWNQLYQGMLYREAIAARKRFDKHERYLRRMSKDTKRKKIGADHSDQIDYILSRLNVRKVSAQAAQRMQDQRVRFQQWLKDQQQSGMDYGISDEMLNIAAERPIQDIPMDSLDGIVDAIEQIYHAGDRIQNARLMQLNKKLAEIKTELIGNVESNSGKIKPSNVTPSTVLGRMKKSFHSFFIRHIKTSTKAYVMDGGELGAFWNFIIRPANRQMGVEQQEVAQITERLQTMMQPFYERGTMTADSGAVMPRRKFDAKSGEWQDDAGRTPRSLTREEVFILALDLGNESNIQRVTDGFGITQEEAMQMVSVLTPEELRVVGQIWDLFAEFKPRISEMERRLNGKEPTYLTPKPIAFRANDGSLVELNGGYLPIKYDRSASELGTSIEAATQARMQLEGSFVGNQTRDTYKKTRVARVFNRPLLLQTSRLFNGLNEVIHDLAWREYLVDANLILRPDGSVSRAIIDNYGSEWMADIRQWMKDIAASGPGPQHPAEQWLGLMRRFISVSRLGFSPVTAALQQTGTVISAQSIGAKHVGDATIKFLSDVVGTHKEMLDKSPEMRNRHRTRFRELGEVAAQIRGKPEKIMALERGAYAMIMYSQMVPDTITWHAAYSRAFEDNPGISDKEAADRAYQAVLDTQGSGDLVNLSTIERGGPGSKLLTVFYTWQNTLFNEIYRIAKTEGLSAEGVARLATLAVVLPFLTVVIRDLAPDDEEEKKKRRTGKGAMSVAEQYAWETLRESVNTLLGTTVGFREVAPTIASVLSGQRAFEYRGPAGFAPIVDFVGTINAAAESGVQSRRFWRQFTNFVGDVAGVPSTQINRTVDGVLALSEGKDVPWWAVVLGTQK